MRLHLRPAARVANRRATWLHRLLRVSDVTTWQTETGRYLPRLEGLWDLVAAEPPHPSVIPRGPTNEPPSPVQGTIHRAVTFYELGLWLRTREITASLLCLWREGHLSTAGSLVRLLFELWAACEYQTAAIREFGKNGDLPKLTKTVNRLFEGVRDDVLLPWGAPASEKPIHVMDTIRHLESVFPGSEATYSQLCESSHANQPRFWEWSVTGRLGDNWSNATVQTRGRTLLENTVGAAEQAVRETISGVRAGLELCANLYTSV